VPRSVQILQVFMHKCNGCKHLLAVLTVDNVVSNQHTTNKMLSYRRETALQGAL